MRAPGLLLTTTLLVGACSDPHSRTNNQALEQQPISQLNQIKGYSTSFKLPEEIGALEATIKEQLEQAMGCPSTIFFQSETGAYQHTDIVSKEKMVLLRDVVNCTTDPDLRACTATAIQYANGKMVNGFTVSGICVPKGAEGVAHDNGLSQEVNLSKRLEETAVIK